MRAVTVFHFKFSCVLISIFEPCFVWKHLCNVLLSWNMILLFKSKLFLDKFCWFFPHLWVAVTFMLELCFFSTFSFQSFIELSRIRKCFTLKGGIFVLEEFGKRYPDFTYFYYLTSPYFFLWCFCIAYPTVFISHTLCLLSVPFVFLSLFYFHLFFQFWKMKTIFVHAVLCSNDISLAVYSSH